MTLLSHFLSVSNFLKFLYLPDVPTDFTGWQQKYSAQGLGRPTASWDLLGEALPAVGGSWSFPPAVRPTWVLYPVPGPSARKIWADWSESSKGPQRQLWDWSNSLELGGFSLEKTRSEGILSKCINTWWGGNNKMEPGCSQSALSNRKRGKGHNSKYRNSFLIL